MPITQQFQDPTSTSQGKGGNTQQAVFVVRPTQPYPEIAQNPPAALSIEDLERERRAYLRQELTMDIHEWISKLLLDLNYTSHRVSPNERYDLQVKEQTLLQGSKREWYCFFAVQLPAMTVQRYLEKLAANLRCGPECIILALILARRVKQAGFPVTPRSVHRLLMACIVLAIKSHEERYMAQSFYAHMGGISMNDMVHMELQTFLTLGCDCSLRTEDYTDMVRQLRGFHERRSRKRPESQSPSVSDWEELLPPVV